MALPGKSRHAWHACGALRLDSIPRAPLKGRLRLDLLQEELGTPALAFVRAVCDALRLDPSIEEEVLVLRRNLLLLTHTLEFAPAAEFRVGLHCVVGT